MEREADDLSIYKVVALWLPVFKSQLYCLAV